MNKAYIQAISYYLPEKIISNEYLASKFPEWGVEKISSKTGIYNRHISAEDETAGDMAIKASERLFCENNISPSTIDFILFCTQSPDYFLPTTACILQNKLNVPKTAGAIDYNLGCSGFIYGLALSKSLITAGIAKNILLITSETYSKHIHNKDKSNRTIFGDGAASTLVSNKGEFEIGDFSFGTDGSGSDYLIVKNGGMRNREMNGSDFYDDTTFLKNDNNLFMNGSEIFNFTATIIPTLVSDTLKKNNITENEVSMYIFHQANKYMLNYVRKKLNIPEEKFFISIENIGNTVSSTIPIAIYEYLRTKPSVPQNILLAGFGVGLSWGGTVIRKKNQE